MEDNTKKTAEFKVLKNGPLQVSGDFVLKSMEGKVLETRNPAFLCRCGGSKNKPFCDGTHRKVGLRD
jgi:CDGSH-type Zn-finger protein